MREVVISIVCDQCESPLTEKTVNEIKVDTTREKYEADLCDSCLENYVMFLRQVKGIRKKPAKPGTTGPHACPFCDKRFSKPAGLTRHVNNQHTTL